MRVKDSIAAGISLVCTDIQAVGCTRASIAIVETVLLGCRVPADRSDSRGSPGSGTNAGSSSGSGGGWALGADWLVEHIKNGITTVRRALALVERLARVQPACSVAEVRVVSSENHEAAWRMSVAVVPAVGLTIASDGGPQLGLGIVAEAGDEGSSAG